MMSFGDPTAWLPMCACQELNHSPASCEGAGDNLEKLCGPVVLEAIGRKAELISRTKTILGGETYPTKQRKGIKS